MSTRTVPTPVAYAVTYRLTSMPTPMSGQGHRAASVPSAAPRPPSPMTEVYPQ